MLVGNEVLKRQACSTYLARASSSSCPRLCPTTGLLVSVDVQTKTMLPHQSSSHPYVDSTAYLCTILLPAAVSPLPGFMHSVCHSDATPTAIGRRRRCYKPVSTGLKSWLPLWRSELYSKKCRGCHCGAHSLESSDRAGRRHLLSHSLEEFRISESIDSRH